MNLEWWNNHLTAAREQVDFVLSHDPGHPRARLMRQRLDASSRPWTLSTSIAYDRFSDRRKAWNEQFISLSRQTLSLGMLDRRGFERVQTIVDARLDGPYSLNMFNVPIRLDR
jgi:hypothetical protein